MARDWFDTGNHGIALGLEYGTMVDAATGGAITPDTVNVKLSNLEAWIKTDDWPFTDSTNKLSCSGALVTDDSWSNISAGTSSSKKLKELSPQSQSITWGSTLTATVALSLTGIEAAGDTLSGSRTFTIPARPYHVPATPAVSLAEGMLYCSGNQTDPLQDSLWEATNWYLETNGVRSTVAEGAAGSQASQVVAMVANKRYRAYVSARNSTGSSGEGASGYWYTTPNAPSGLIVTRAVGSTLVNLSWAANGAAYVGAYQLYRSLNGGAYSLLKSVNTLSTTDTVPLGSTASYYVVAQTPAGVNQKVSANSAIATVGAGYNVPNAPGVSLVRTGSSTATITISGNQNTATSDRYTAQLDWQIQVNGAAFSGGASNLAGTTTSIPITGLPANAQIRVQARFGNSSGESAWAQSGYLYTTPSAPSDFVAARADAASSTVNLSWTNNAGYPASFLLDKLINGIWSQVATIVAPATSGSVLQGQAESASYRLRVVTPDNQYSSYAAEQVVGVAFVSSKNNARLGASALDYCYVGEQRVRRIYKGATVLWEDGDA